MLLFSFFHFIWFAVYLGTGWPTGQPADRSTDGQTVSPIKWFAKSPLFRHLNFEFHAQNFTAVCNASQFEFSVFLVKLMNVLIIGSVSSDCLCTHAHRYMYVRIWRTHLYNLYMLRWEHRHQKFPTNWGNRSDVPYGDDTYNHETNTSCQCVCGLCVNQPSCIFVAVWMQ